MPGMIDYAVLCNAIEEWKSGAPASAVPAARPAIPTPAARRAAPVEEPEEVVEYSGLYESPEAAEAPAEPAESTVIYQLPDYDNVEVNEEEQ